MKKMYTITVNNDEYARGIYATREEAVKDAAQWAKDDNPEMWEGLDDEDVYEYQDGYYRVIEMDIPDNVSVVEEK